MSDAEPEAGGGKGGGESPPPAPAAPPSPPGALLRKLPPNVRRRVRSGSGGVVRTIGVLGALATAITGIVAAIQILPGDDAAPARLGVNVDRVSVDGQATLEDFQKGQAQVASGLLTAPPRAVAGRIEEDPLVVRNFQTEYVDLERKPSPRDTGLLIGVRLTLEGLKGQRLPVRWALLDARCRPPLQFATAGAQVAFVVPRAETDSGSFDIWVQQPTGTGRYRVMVQVGDGSDDAKGSGSSEDFETSAPGVPSQSVCAQSAQTSGGGEAPR